MKNLRIAAFGGFRSIPPTKGGAGADKFAFELYPRISGRGHHVTAYCRIYPGEEKPAAQQFDGVDLIYFKTVGKDGFDSLVHSFKATFDIILRNRAKIVHINSGANSIWALFLRLAGKKVYVSQFAMDWKRNKWPFYGKAYYWLSNYFTALFPSEVIFDNIYTQAYFEKKFRKKFRHIPYGSEVTEPNGNTEILGKLGLRSKGYFLFVGRFIPDKGLHLLLDAYQGFRTKKKLVLVGGAPNPNEYEKQIKAFANESILFPGFMYGDEVNTLIKNSYAYIQPSLIEGLSPVILTAMGLGTPVICSDIKENLYITGKNALPFVSGSAESLQESLAYSLDNPGVLLENATRGMKDIRERFNWERIADQYIEAFSAK